MIYLFGDYELDTQRYELRRSGQRIPLEPRVFQVLVYLIQQRDRMVPKREILEHLWPQQFVSEWALSRCIKEIRRAVGCSGRRPQYIKTLYSHGYRFIAAVTEYPQAPPIGSTPRDPNASHTLTRDGAEYAETPLSLAPLRDHDDLQVDDEYKRLRSCAGVLPMLP